MNALIRLRSGFAKPANTAGCCHRKRNLRASSRPAAYQARARTSSSSPVSGPRMLDHGKYSVQHYKITSVQNITGYLTLLCIKIASP